MLTPSGFEVDFHGIRPGGRPTLVQVAADLVDASTRERELRALEDAMHEQHIEESTLVTLADEQSVSLPTGEVQIVPAWRWLLEPED